MTSRKMLGTALRQNKSAEGIFAVWKGCKATLDARVCGDDLARSLVKDGSATLVVLPQHTEVCSFP